MNAPPSTTPAASSATGSSTAVTSPPSATGPSAWWALGMLVLDAVLVIVFAALGQDQHATAAGLPHLLTTAAPFLTGLVLLTVLTAGHRTADRVWPQGVLVWLGTVAVGMALRVWWGLGGAPLSFILVTLAVLGVLLLGRRALTGLLTRRRRRA